MSEQAVSPLFASVYAAAQATAEKAGRVFPAPPVPGWPPVFIRAINTLELFSNLSGIRDDQNQDAGIQAVRGLARVLCDENGVRLFDPDNEDHIAVLGKQPPAITNELLAATRRINDGGDDEDMGKSSPPESNS